MSVDDAAMSQRLARLSATLSSFAASTDVFRVVASTPTFQPAKPAERPSLYILDSSFNPPTLAHLRIALSALLSHDHTRSTSRMMLLLATTNADKASQPASFDHRLMMMDLFARELLQQYNAARPEGSGAPSTIEAGRRPEVDICITKLPYFVNKAVAVSECGAYAPDTEQTHLVGFDTLIRILDPKYYPPGHSLAPVQPFLDKHRLRVTYRTDDAWGSRAEEDAYLQGIAAGGLVDVGGKTEWADRIDLVGGRPEGEAVISSTRARKAVERGDVAELRTMVSVSIADWIEEFNLYR